MIPSFLVKSIQAKPTIKVTIEEKPPLQKDTQKSESILLEKEYKDFSYNLDRLFYLKMLSFFIPPYSTELFGT